MRNKDGLQPQEAFDELLKYLHFKQNSELKSEEISIELPLSPDGDFNTSDARAIKKIRTQFSCYLKSSGEGVREIWPEGKIRLSDDTLHSIHSLFQDVRISELPVDIRSAALRLFISSEARRGTGIFLTPDDVVKAIVKVVDPSIGLAVYDPACGSGTFLIETVKHWRLQRASSKKLSVHGSDINSRMLLLAHLNLDNSSEVQFHSQILDALSEEKSGTSWPRPNSFDVVLANPPFGVYVSSKEDSAKKSQTPSEMLFTLNCLKWLKPNGVLGIIVPKSVVSNKSLSAARRAIDKLGELKAVLNLPPETFSSTGTQTNTTVLFFRKRAKAAPKSGKINIPVIDVLNVGVDSTGRHRPGSDLEQAANDLKQSMTTGRATGKVRMFSADSACPLDSLTATAQNTRQGSKIKLGDLVELAQTGRTPARSAYVEDGIFTVKVGNLTGQGIDWCPRERNFAAPERVSDKLLLEDGDILLTSSAHNPRYIAQKVDIVSTIPSWLNGRATFTGEVLRLRANKSKISPFELLGLLRMPSVKMAIRELIRGQTAHLRPDDLVNISVDPTIISKQLVKLLEEEARLYTHLNIIARHQAELLK
jgi:type I restriction enzyme M protein